MLMIVLRAIRQRGDSLAEIAELREQQISAREEENRSIIENSVVGIVILDHRRQVLFANHAALEVFNEVEDGMGGRPLSDFVTPAQGIHDDAGYNATGTTRDGAELYLDVHHNDWVTLNGVKRVTAIVRDVTAEVGAVGELAVIKETLRSCVGRVRDWCLLKFTSRLENRLSRRLGERLRKWPPRSRIPKRPS